MARQVGDIEAVEDGELDRLVRAVWKLSRRLVELLDLVDRRQVGPAELGEAPPERKSRADPPDEAGVGERPEDIGDRGLRDPQSPSELARAGRFAGLLRQNAEKRCGPRDGRCERLGLRVAAIIVRRLECRRAVPSLKRLRAPAIHRRASGHPLAPGPVQAPWTAGWTPYNILTSRAGGWHTVQPTAARSVCWTVFAGSRGGNPCRDSERSRLWSA